MKTALAVALLSLYLTCLSYARDRRAGALFPNNDTLSTNSTGGTVSEWDSDILRIA
jgi:hypothetical protein